MTTWNWQPSDTYPSSSQRTDTNLGAMRCNEWIALKFLKSLTFIVQASGLLFVLTDFHTMMKSKDVQLECLPRLHSCRRQSLLNTTLEYPITFFPIWSINTFQSRISLSTSSSATNRIKIYDYFKVRSNT